MGDLYWLIIYDQLTLLLGVLVLIEKCTRLISNLVKSLDSLIYSRMMDDATVMLL